MFMILLAFLAIDAVFVSIKENALKKCNGCHGILFYVDYFV
jgi:hypothetical protein